MTEPELPRTDVAVVYPTIGRPELLLRSISALGRNELLPREIVVVDQSRSDATERAIAGLGDPTVVVVRTAERGLSRARNLGVRSSRAPIVAFIDDDCIPAPNWMSNARELIERTPASGVWIGGFVPSEAELVFASDFVEWTVTQTRGFDPWRYDPTGGNSFFRRSVLEQVGEFDPLLGQGSEFPGAEDGDMVYRVLRRGIPVTFTNCIRCHHLPWRSNDEKVENRFNYGLGVGAMLAKHVERGDRLPMAYIFARHFLKKFLVIPYYRLRGDHYRYQRNLRWSQGIIHGYGGWRRARGSA